MPKTLRNQELMHAESYDKVVVVGYKCMPYHSQCTMYNRGYNMYDTYYIFPTRQTTYHMALRDKFKTWKKMFIAI